MFIRVAIVEDDDDIRQSLGLIIDGTPGYACTQLFRDCEQALRSLPTHPPDVVLMDINLPGMSGIAGTAKLKAQLPDLDIIMVTVNADDQHVFDALCAGATGYMLKDVSPDRLLAAIQEVREGGAPMSANIARRVLHSFHRSPTTPLSARETEILRLLCEGHNYKIIAEGLSVSGHTVRSHIKNIYQKLQVSSRAEAVKRAIEDQLI